MTYLMGYMLVFGLLALSPMAAAGRGGEKPGELIVRAEGGMLTLKASDVSHRRILEGLAKQLNFELIVAGPLEERRSLEIDGRPWEEALKKALSPASWAFVYNSSGGEPQLAKVFVFPSKNDGAGPARPSSSPGRVAAQAPAPRPPAPRPTPVLQGSRVSQRAEQSSDPSVGELLEAEDDETRALALVSLATTGGEEAIVGLRRALQDKEPWIRETAVEALAEIGGEQAIQGLQQALRDESEDVRRAAQEALIRLQPNPQ
jgi:predicted component of type VI protein secretion system